MADPKTGRVVSQDDWKRTQVRMPQEQYEAIVEFADENNLSLNSAMIDLMSKGFASLNEASLGYELDFKHFPLNFENMESKQDNPLLKVKEFFSQNSQFKVINIDSTEEGIICWFHRKRINV